MMTRDEIVAWLREEDASRLQLLWRQADEVRRQNVGDAVHLRGLIEFSNHCVRRCAYCGIRGESRDLQRRAKDKKERVEGGLRDKARLHRCTQHIPKPSVIDFSR